jgi:hypothetical protein
MMGIEMWMVDGGCGEAGRSRPFLPSPGNPEAEKDSAAAPLV